VKKLKKLTIKRETLRELTVDQLRSVRGAMVSADGGGGGGDGGYVPPDQSSSGCPNPTINQTGSCPSTPPGGTMPVATTGCGGG
jgi:hypothetical protein